MPSPENVRLAVLIDADNTSPKHASVLLEEVAKYGVPTIKRAYGDWTDHHLSGWKREVSTYAIQPMLQIANTTGKNSTDSALIIDAMDLLYSGNVDAFAIVSSDSDFTSLAIRLRASGRTVYGFGLRKTPQALQQACDRFVFLEVLARDGSSEQTEDAAPLPDLRPILTSAIDDTANDDGWANLGAVGSVLNTRYPSFDSRNYGFSRLIALVRAQDYLEVEQDGSPLVRLKPQSTQKTTATRTAKKASAKTAKKR